MKDWIDIVREKVLEEKLALPPNDWEEFEARYLDKKKRFWIIPLSAAAVISTVVAILFISKPPEDHASLISAAPSVDHQTISIKQDEDTMEERPLVIIKTHDDDAGICEEMVNEEVKDGEIMDNQKSDIENKYIAEKEDIDTKDDIEYYETSGSDNRIRLTFAPYFGGIRSEATAIVPAYHSGSLSYYSAALLKKGYLLIGESPTDISSFKASHSVPISIGLDVSAELNNRFSLTTGLELSQYASRISTMEQKATYLGIPLRIDYTILNEGRFSAWLGIGGKVDYLIYGNIGEERLVDKSLHWSVLSNVGIQYDLFKNFGVFISPVISYYFKPSEPAIITYRTEKPLMLNLSAGLKFTLDNQ